MCQGRQPTGRHFARQEAMLSPIAARQERLGEAWVRRQPSRSCPVSARHGVCVMARKPGMRPATGSPSRSL
jgi:hypothetical protein